MVWKGGTLKLKKQVISHADNVKEKACHLKKLFLYIRNSCSALYFAGSLFARVKGVAKSRSSFLLEHFMSVMDIKTFTIVGRALSVHSILYILFGPITEATLKLEEFCEAVGAALGDMFKSGAKWNLVAFSSFRVQFMCAFRFNSAAITEDRALVVHSNHNIAIGTRSNTSVFRLWKIFKTVIRKAGSLRIVEESMSIVGIKAFTVVGPSSGVRSVLYRPAGPRTHATSKLEKLGEALGITIATMYGSETTWNLRSFSYHGIEFVCALGVNNVGAIENANARSKYIHCMRVVLQGILMSIISRAFQLPVKIFDVTCSNLRNTLYSSFGHLRNYVQRAVHQILVSVVLPVLKMLPKVGLSISEGVRSVLSTSILLVAKDVFGKELIMAILKDIESLWNQICDVFSLTASLCTGERPSLLLHLPTASQEQMQITAASDSVEDQNQDTEIQEPSQVAQAPVECDGDQNPEIEENPAPPGVPCDQDQEVEKMGTPEPLKVPVHFEKNEQRLAEDRRLYRRKLILVIPSSGNGSRQGTTPFYYAHEIPVHEMPNVEYFVKHYDEYCCR